MDAALDFLTRLNRHNDRTWFEAHRDEYRRDVHEPLRAFVAGLSDACERRRIPLYGDERRSIFRIHRDLRFTPDKRPYKDHAAAYLSRDGGRTTQGGFYLRISPEGSWMSVAFYLLPPAALRRWRIAMAEEPKAFSRIVASLRAKRLRIVEPQEWDDGLKRMPREFQTFAASPLAPYFRLRSFAVRRPLRRSELASGRLVRAALAFIEAAGPLLRYGWRIVDSAGDDPDYVP